MMKPSSIISRSILIAAVVLFAGCTGIAINKGSKAASGGLSEGLAAAYLSGRLALSSKDYAMASEEFERALRADPTNVELKSNLFYLNLANGNFERALSYAAELKESGDDSVEVNLLLAFSDLRNNRLNQFEDQIDGLPTTGLIKLIDPVLKGWLAFEKDDLDRAYSIMEPQDGDDSLFQIRNFHLASIQALAGEEAKALDTLEQISGEGGQMPIRLMLATIYLTEKIGGDVTALLREQTSLFPRDQVLSKIVPIAEQGKIGLPITGGKSGISDAFFSLARAYSEQGQRDQAVIYAQLAAFLDPDKIDIRYLIAQLQLGDERAAAALNTLSGFEEDPIYGFQVQLLRSEALRDVGRMGEAVALLNSMSEAEPERTEALVQLGDFHRADENYELAEKAYQLAVERLGEPQPSDWRLFHVYGISLERTDRWPEAEESFLKALELQPDQPYVLNYLGYSWVDQKVNLNRATEMLVQAVELRPNDGFITDSLGWAYYRLGMFDKAVIYLEKAIELEPADPVINDHLGDAYWKAGRKREARFQWERALIFEPDEEIKLNVEQKLAQGLPSTGQ